MADPQRDLDRLIREEETVIRHYVRPRQLAAQKGQHVRVRESAAARRANQKRRRIVLGRRRGHRPPAHGQRLRCRRSVGMRRLRQSARARAGRRLGRRSRACAPCWRTSMAIPWPRTKPCMRRASFRSRSRGRRDADGRRSTDSAPPGRSALRACAAGSVRERDRDSRRFWRCPIPPRQGCCRKGPLGRARAAIPGAGPRKAS